MTPAARLTAAIELLGAIEGTFEEGGAAADVLIERYFKQRRYAGSHDRRWITDHVYAALRRRGALIWRLTMAGLPASPRGALLLLLAEEETLGESWFQGAHAVPVPTAEERAALGRAQALGTPPDWVRHNVPDWLEGLLTARFGPRLDEEMTALAARAPTDLRVGTARIGRDAALDALAKSGIEARPTPWSPIGIRLEKDHNIKRLKLFREGQLELQDESSQIASLLTGAEPGEQVAELCAGTGGKTLVLSEMMAGRGQIFAMDQDRRRLAMLKKRAARAGVRNVQVHRLTQGAEKRRRQLAPFAGAFDLVVVDAPCSGSGTWRRNPELRWRLDPERVARFAAVQATLLAEGMALTKPGGRLAYMTCSILGEENEAVLESAVAAVQGWQVIDSREALERAGIAALPPSAAGPGTMLQLTPARHGCDGFFVALLRKSA